MLMRMLLWKNFNCCRLSCNHIRLFLSLKLNHREIIYTYHGESENWPLPLPKYGFMHTLNIIFKIPP